MSPIWIWRIFIACAVGTIALLGGRAVFSPAQAQTIQVQVGDNFFAPDPIVIPPGSTVIWSNVGHADHTVTSDDGTGEQFDSKTLSPGGSFSHTFNQQGAFTYHCIFHEAMLGTVIVQDPAAATATILALTPTARPRPTATPVPAHRGKHTVLAQTVGVSYRFTPKTLRVKIGVKVTWQNVGSTLHTISSRTRGWTFDEKLKSHRRVSFVFRKAGTYAYYCRFHAGMVGEIIVHR